MRSITSPKSAERSIERFGENIPPHDMPLLRGLRPLKRWRYVAIFCEEFAACAALVQVGPAHQSFWALCPRDGRVQRGRTRLLPRRGEIELTAGRRDGDGESRPTAQGHLRVRDAGVELDLELDEEPGFDATCAHGRREVWTRKQAGVRAHGMLTLDGGSPRALEGLAVIDDTAGYHARVTEWRWSAGVGEGRDGTPLAWNLVSGVNDPRSGSERAVWVDGQPHEVPTVAFSEDLSLIRCDDGAELRFDAEARRSRRDNLVIVSSDYIASFGTFSGDLPGGLSLARGHGVVEHHRARW